MVEVGVKSTGWPFARNSLEKLVDVYVDVPFTTTQAVPTVTGVIHLLHVEVMAPAKGPVVQLCCTAAAKFNELESRAASFFMMCPNT